MVRLEDTKWSALRHRLKQGEVLTSAEMAEVLQRYGGTGIPDDIRHVLAERLSKAPTPRRGRPKHTPEDERIREAWILSVYNRVTQLRSRGMRKADAVKAYAAESGRSVEYIADLLVNHAPRVRRKHPALAFSVERWREMESQAPDETRAFDPAPETVPDIPPDSARGSSVQS